MTTSTAQADLDFLTEYWPDLNQAIAPGTRRPRTATRLTHDQEALRDAAAHLEQLERSASAPGESPAPLDIDALDLVSEIGAAADTLARELAIATRCPKLAPIPSLYADPLRWLDFAGHRLAELDAFAAEAEQALNDELDRMHAEAERQAAEIGQALHEGLTDARRLADQSAGVLHRLAQRTAQTLGMAYDGQTIQAVCPWCKGITGYAPEGGEHTWRVRILPGDQIAIVCESDTCEPPLHEVATWWWGWPVWPLAHWERLAKHLA